MNQPVEYRVVFRDPRLNVCAARLCFTCHWHFRDDWRNENGWRASHYFSTPGKHPVTVTFTDDQGEPVRSQTAAVELHRNTDVQESVDPRLGERARIEGVQLAIVVIVACCALLAGAMQQLAKLDFVPGLIAVCALGFSADQLKSAIAGRKGAA